MVSTRNHPRDFQATSSKRNPTTTITPTSSPPSSPTRTPQTTPLWSHTPSNLTLLWLTLSLPLVIWDTGYVMLRPHSMPGGRLHAPIWSPYALYGQIDYIYGLPAWEAHNGFTAGQAALNVVETVGYFVYLWIVWREGEEIGGAGRKGAPWGIGYGIGGKRSMKPRRVEGRVGAAAVLLGFAVAVMTLSKTVLYWLCEYYSGFHNIGHNKALDLIFLWVIPNGLWLLFPTYMIYVFGYEIMAGLEAAALEGKKRR